jgi:hypothetical protein
MDAKQLTPHDDQLQANGVVACRGDAGILPPIVGGPAQTKETRECLKESSRERKS